MNICILSMQRVLNYGSVLQAYGLKKLLESLGHNVEFIDISRNEEENAFFNEHISEEKKKKIMDRQQTSLEKLTFYPWRQPYVKKENADFARTIKEFQNNVLKLSDNIISHYDYCVIGSDEVFNCLNNSGWGFTTQLFGNVSQANNVLTYAASSGATHSNQLSEPIRKCIKKYLSNFPIISVRDENTKKFVSDICDVPVVRHFDPVLITNFDKEVNLVELPRTITSHYCIVYSYYKRFSNYKEAKIIKKFAKNNNMELISIEGPQLWIKHHKNLSPFQALKAFQNASFVITDTFHGALFASKYSKKYAVIMRNSNKEKISDLLVNLNRNNHMIKNISYENLDRTYSIINRVSEVTEFQIKEYHRSKSYFVQHIC